MRFTAAILLLLTGIGATSCGSAKRPAGVPVVRPVSLQIEVYDPFTGFAVDNVAIRVVRGSLEWSGQTLQNPDPNHWFYTDGFGTALFDAYSLAEAQVGFIEDTYQRAILEPFDDADEAWLTVELVLPGYPAVRADVPLTWDAPDVFVSIPY